MLAERFCAARSYHLGMQQPLINVLIYFIASSCCTCTKFDAMNGDATQGQLDQHHDPCTSSLCTPVGLKRCLAAFHSVLPMQVMEKQLKSCKILLQRALASADGAPPGPAHIEIWKYH